jgi:crotonobetainyl-CoA:carnitine CoA-transferase CaiB-like acyl-CoA transferase
VLRYASDFIPSWAGAIAIDLMPGVLVLILMVVQGAIREREGGSDQVLQVTMGDMAAALAAQERLDQLRARARKRLEEAEEAAAAAPTPAPAPKPGEAEVTLAFDASRVHPDRRPRSGEGA